MTAQAVGLAAACDYLTELGMDRVAAELMLDELVTETRPLEGFREIVEDMHAGKLARGVLTL